MPTLHPATERRTSPAAPGDLPPWSMPTMRARLPALLALLAAGEVDQAADLCREPDIDPGLFGGVSTDPTQREQ